MSVSRRENEEGYRHLESLLDQLPHMVLDAQVGQQAGQDYPVDASLAELKDEVVGLRPPDFM